MKIIDGNEWQITTKICPKCGKNHLLIINVRKVDDINSEKTIGIKTDISISSLFEDFQHFYELFNYKDNFDELMNFLKFFIEKMEIEYKRKEVNKFDERINLLKETYQKLHSFRETCEILDDEPDAKDSV